jgi:hypothetical protein
MPRTLNTGSSNKLARLRLASWTYTAGYFAYVVVAGIKVCPTMTWRSRRPSRDERLRSRQTTTRQRDLTKLRLSERHRPVAHVFNCRVAYCFTYCFKSLSMSGRTLGQIQAEVVIFSRSKRDSHDYTVAYLFGDPSPERRPELSSTSACRQEAAHGRTVIA